MTDLETTASMQEQLARRDHRIAVLEAIVAAKTARIEALDDFAHTAAAKLASLSLEDGDIVLAELLDGQSVPHAHRALGSVLRLSGKRNQVIFTGGAKIEVVPDGNPHSLVLSRAIASDKPLDAYGRQ